MSIVQGEETRGSSTGRGTSTYQYPQLTTSNYTSWAIRVQAIMENQGVWAAVQPAAGAAVDLKLDKRLEHIYFRLFWKTFLCRLQRRYRRMKSGNP